MITSKMNEAENHASEERFSRHRNTAVIEMDVKTTISSFFCVLPKFWSIKTNTQGYHWKWLTPQRSAASTLEHMFFISGACF